MKYHFCSECEFGSDSFQCLLLGESCELFGLTLDFIQISIDLFTYSDEDRKLMESYLKELSSKIFEKLSFLQISNFVNRKTEFIETTYKEESGIGLVAKLGLRRGFDIFCVEAMGRG
jgi:hypothetical protein